MSLILLTGDRRPKIIQKHVGEKVMQCISKVPTKSFCLALIALFLAAAWALAQTSAPDVGLITKLTGEATYWNKQEKKPSPVQAFMKVRQGAAAMQAWRRARPRAETRKVPRTERG